MRLVKVKIILVSILCFMCSVGLATTRQVSLQEYTDLSSHFRLPGAFPSVVVFEDNQLKNMQSIFSSASTAKSHIDEQGFLVFLKNTKVGKQGFSLAEFSEYLPELKKDFGHLIKSEKKYKMVVLMPLFKESDLQQVDSLYYKRKTMITDLSNKQGQVELMFLGLKMFQ